MEYKHLMIDLETMGKDSNAAIVAIAAVQFDLKTGAVGETFYEKVDLGSCLDLGMVVDGDTVMWWLRQSEAARNSIQNPKYVLAAVMEMFRGFCLDSSSDWEQLQVWSNGASFDLPILKNALIKIHPISPFPWKYYNERDVRTLLSLAPEAKSMVSKPKIEHHAAYDALYQIEYCCKAYQIITNR